MFSSFLYGDVVSSYSVSSTFLLILGLAGLLMSTLYWKSANAKQKHHSKLPPVAPRGMLHTIQAMNKNAPFFLRDMVKETGSDIIRLRLPIPGGAYAVGNPAAMRTILTDNTTDKPREMYAAFDNVTGGKSMFTRANTKEWKSARKCLSYSFSSSEVNRMNHICTDQVNSWIQDRLEPCIEKNEAFDPSAEMTHLTFNIILEAGFEHPKISDEEYHSFIHHLEVCLREFAGRHNGNPVRKYYGFLLSEFREAKRSCEVVTAFSAKILEAYRKNPNKSKNKTIIRMIVENKDYKSDKERMSDIMTMVIAGHETTGFTLGTTLVLLGKHPKVAEKLRHELSSMGESKRSSRSGYFHNVVRESKRIVPVAALGSIRITGRDLSFKNGSIVIPKGATCFVPMILPHHHEETFKDPENFRPERWEKEDDKMRAALMSFSLGNRDCIGQSLAVAEIYSVLPRLLTDYKFEVEEEGNLEHFLTLKYVGARLKPIKIGCS